MPPRASWKGFLRISLVTCPIALYPATSSTGRISFNRINRATGARVRQLNVDARTGEKVENEDIVRGYEVDRDRYVILEDEEIEAIQVEASKVIDVTLRTRWTAFSWIRPITSRRRARLVRRPTE